MAKFYYQGHGSYRVTAGDGRVIYVDPYAGGGYDKPADIILVTHQHGDHNQVQLVTRKPDCRVITNKEALAGGRHNTFDLGGITVEAVEAKNLLHSPKKCVGFIIALDGVSVYCSGDTSKTKTMEDFGARNLDWAIFCGDGKFNMNRKEAAECARVVGAKHNIIVHIAPGKLFDRVKADQWDAPDKVVIEPGEEIEL